MNSITMLWALWGSVSVMPFTWTPPFKTGASVSASRAAPETLEREDCERRRWEICSNTRLRLLGEEASMLVAAFHAYCMLPGRQIGTMCKTVSSSSSSSSSFASSDHEDEQEQGVVLEVNLHVSHNVIEPRLVRSTNQNHVEGSSHDANDNSDDGLDWYYRSSHFTRVSVHGAKAWEDCMWLLTLQEPCVVKVGDQKHVAVPWSGRASVDLRCDETMDDSFINSRPSKSRRVSAPIDDEDETHCPPGCSTAFREYAKEFSILKPFLMYVAVPASGMGMVNASYLDILNVQPPSKA